MTLPRESDSKHLCSVVVVWYSTVPVVDNSGDTALATKVRRGNSVPSSGKIVVVGNCVRL